MSGPPRNDVRYRAAALTALHLASVDSPLSTQLRHNRSAAYTIMARVQPELGEGWLSLEVIVRADNSPDIALLLGEEIQRLRSEPPSQERVIALRLRMLSQIARALADNRGRCSDAISSVLYGLGINHHRQIEIGFSNLKYNDVRGSIESLDAQRIVGFETPIRTVTP